MSHCHPYFMDAIRKDAFSAGLRGTTVFETAERLEADLCHVGQAFRQMARGGELEYLTAKRGSHNIVRSRAFLSAGMVA